MSRASRPIIVGVLIMAGALALARASNAATITVNAPDQYGRTVVDVVGDILIGDDKTFQAKVGTLAEPEFGALNCAEGAEAHPCAFG